MTIRWPSTSRIQTWSCSPSSASRLGAARDRGPSIEVPAVAVPDGVVGGVVEEATGVAVDRDRVGRRARRCRVARQARPPGRRRCRRSVRVQLALLGPQGSANTLFGRPDREPDTRADPATACTSLCRRLRRRPTRTQSSPSWSVTRAGKGRRWSWSSGRRPTRTRDGDGETDGVGLALGGRRGLRPWGRSLARTHGEHEDRGRSDRDTSDVGHVGFPPRADDDPLSCAFDVVADGVVGPLGSSVGPSSRNARMSRSGSRGAVMPVAPRRWTGFGNRPRCSLAALLVAWWSRDLTVPIGMASRSATSASGRPR